MGHKRPTVIKLDRPWSKIKRSQRDLESNMSKLYIRLP